YNGATIASSVYEVEYYTGDSRFLNPAHSDYDPNASAVCTNSQNAAGWSASPPTDLGQVRAVRVLYQNVDLPHSDSRPALRVNQQVKADVPDGMDIWVWSDFRRLGAGTEGRWASADDVSVV